LREWWILAAADAEYVIVAPATLAALLAEVERLRSFMQQARTIYLQGSMTDKTRARYQRLFSEMQNY
jgi:hypothetical protein